MLRTDGPGAAGAAGAWVEAQVHTVHTHHKRAVAPLNEVVLFQLQ